MCGDNCFNYNLTSDTCKIIYSKGCGSYCFPSIPAVISDGPNKESGTIIGSIGACTMIIFFFVFLFFCSPREG